MAEARNKLADCIDFEKLEANIDTYRKAFQTAVPFRFLMIDEFCYDDAARALARSFPTPDKNWIDASGLNTRRKSTSPVNAKSAASKFFAEAQSERFINWLEKVTFIENILTDDKYFGAGFHQTMDGGYLNVHIDFNKLNNGLDRRLNVLLYMNENWHASWGGEIELWDIARKRCIFSALPKLNRMVMFETNEISYHGQPNPVRTAGKASRNSFSIYYYTAGRPEHEVAPSHSTIYANVNGLAGTMRNCANALRQIISLAPLKRRYKK